MKTFAINTLGCKVNQYESQQIRQLLQNHKLTQVTLDKGPDLIVINTCCVTHIASSKSRQYIRKARKINKKATVVVAGCLPVGQTDELQKLTEDIHLVTRKEDLAKTLHDLLDGNDNSYSNARCSNRTSKSPKIKYKNGVTDEIEYACADEPVKEHDKLEPLASYEGQSRAFLKVQDGCDGYCTYCIIPQIRKKISYKPKSIVLKEALALVYAGHKEIVLTGIFLGAYGKDTVRRKKWISPKDSLAELLDDVAQVPGLTRVRLSSLEPADVTDKLLDVMCRHKNIAPHLHLPLQSGSQNILKRMCRQYSLDDFRSTIDRARSSLDRPAITTDIIVGFPGETEDDFKKTLEMAKYAGFAKIHVFSFSPRSNTPAATMKPTVPPEVIKERSAILRHLDENLQNDFRKLFAGEKVSVILEGNKASQGRTERYFMVEIAGAPEAKEGQIIHGILRDNCKVADFVH